VRRLRRRTRPRPPREPEQFSFEEKVAADRHVRWLLRLVAAHDPRVDLDATEEEYARRCCEWAQRLEVSA